MALATVVRTWGSAPRDAGSHMAVTDGGTFCGSVSGGCVEAAVVDASTGVIASGEGRTLAFGVTDEMAWEVGLACGGKVEIRVDAVEGALLDALLRDVDAKRPVVLATRMRSGEQALLRPLENVSGPSDGAAPSREGGPDGWPVEAARQSLLEDRATTVEAEAGDVFLRPYNPPVRLLVVGAVHVTAPLARMATAAGFEVHVVDPRSLFASEERFPGLHLVHAWPGPAFEELRPDHRTAVITLTHDAKLDDPALVAALATRAFYVGALGSRRTHGKRLLRLRERGVPEEDLRRIHAPIGLDIGARSPAEIAVAILAEVVSTLRGGTVGQAPPASSPESSPESSPA